MAIPVQFQNFKAAGIYRVVYDKSTIEGVDSEILRLVVGYSEKGPFNTPVYVKDEQVFKTLFGDISKKLEKRGVWFHRLALQALKGGPILALNLKKFDGETVGASTISTDFNSVNDPIDTVHLNVEDIYDTTRFWTLSAETLNDLQSVEGQRLNEYINIAETDEQRAGVTYFIRKANGTKVSQYNVTVSDWYSDEDAVPEYLSNYKHSLISDFFAEIYVFKGKFTAKQVMSSETLKNYFTVVEDDFGDKQLQLRPYVLNGYGQPTDTLDLLYSDDTSNAIGHWIGSLIPEFKTKQGRYVALDIIFNADHDEHGMMMSFNTDLLEDEDPISIDLSGRTRIPQDVNQTTSADTLRLTQFKEGTATATVLGNIKAPVITDTITFGTNMVDWVSETDDDNNVRMVAVPRNKFSTDKSHVYGSLVVAEVNDESNVNTIVLRQIATTDKVNINIPEVNKFELINDLIGSLSDANNYYRLVADATETEAAQYESIADRWETICGNEELTDEAKADQLINAEGDEAMSKYILNKSDEEDAPTFATLYASATETAVENRQQVVYRIAVRLGVKAHYNDDGTIADIIRENGEGTYWAAVTDEDNEEDVMSTAFIDTLIPLNGPEKVITALSRIEAPSGYKYWTINTTDKDYTDADRNLKPSFKAPAIETISNLNYSADADSLDILAIKRNVYGTSVSFIDEGAWKLCSESEESKVTINGADYTGDALYCDVKFDTSLSQLINVGDCFIAEDGILDYDGDGEITDRDKDNYYDNVYVTEIGTEYYEDGTFKCNYVLFSGAPLLYEDTKDGKTYLMRIDAALCQEIGTMAPTYLEGYTYKNDRPNGTGMYARLEWQRFLLSALGDYKGLRIGLLNRSEIDYRYIIDTFEALPQNELRRELSLLAKDKDSAFVIGNFPAVQTFRKCPYASFTDSKGMFDVNYIVKGSNNKKPSSISFSLPSETDGASFIAFYTPLKFSDGYIDTIVPSAALVSNLFIEKYRSRQPYYIVAGPNYSSISAANLVGPDYHYSKDERQIIEPYGVNCMVYRPSFGTFIAANQTAKQTPVSALSRVNIRELVIYLQDEIEKVLQAYQWEFNNATTRQAIKDKADQICELIRANGGIQAYLNVMDTSNNTNEIIDNEMAVLRTSIEPGFGCGKMIQELTIYRTGQLKSVITEDVN